MDAMDLWDMTHAKGLHFQHLGPKFRKDVF